MDNQLAEERKGNNGELKRPAAVQANLNEDLEDTENFDSHENMLEGDKVPCSVENCKDWKVRECTYRISDSC